jgi:hypothetical protein
MKQELPIGCRVKVDNYDTPAYYLPVSGTITRQLKSTDGVDNWFLLELDAPIQYQYKVGDGPFQFRGQLCPASVPFRRMVRLDVAACQDHGAA